VREVAQDVSRRAALKQLVLDPIQQTLASGSKGGIGRGGVDKAVGVDEDNGSTGKIVKRHGKSTNFRRGRSDNAEVLRDYGST
jgi:hypothetical protein